MQVSRTGQQVIRVLFVLFMWPLSVVFVIRLQTSAALGCCAFKKTPICAYMRTLKLYHSQLANACISSAVSSTREKHNSPGPVTQSSLRLNNSAPLVISNTHKHICVVHPQAYYMSITVKAFGFFFLLLGAGYLSLVNKVGGLPTLNKEPLKDDPLLHMRSSSHAWIIQAGKDKS